MQPSPPDRLEKTLQAVEAGIPGAAEQFLPLLYEELRRLARALLAKVPPGNTLQPTALVHEAYLRLIGDSDPGWSSRGHFFGAAAQAMRQILVEQARRKSALKHGRGLRRQELDPEEVAIESPVEDMLALDEALERLHDYDARKARVVMLRFFAGLSIAETAAALGVSEPTVERDWAFARALLFEELFGPPRDPGPGAAAP